MSEVKKVLFVCLGNICRSPIAEGVFCNLIKQRGVANDWEVDSAAIGCWHIGKAPDQRACDTLSKHNIPYSNKARQIKTADFNNYDFIFGMDEDNISDLTYMAPKNSKAKIKLLGEYDPEGERIIRDPYYDSNSKGFEKCYEQCMRCCESFLNEIYK